MVQRRAAIMSTIFSRTASKGNVCPSIRRASRITCQPKRDRIGRRQVSPGASASMASCTSGTRSPRRTCPSDPSCCAEGHPDSSRAATANAAALSPPARGMFRAVTPAADQASASPLSGSIRICDADAWSAAGVTARNIAREVGDNAAAFAVAARELSGCPSAQQDGSLGQVRRGDLVPEVQDAIEALAPGETCRRPIRSRFGWHVIRLARRIEGQTLPFEAVREKIADMMAARRWTMDAARYVARLAEGAEIEGVAIEPVDMA